MNRLFTFRLTCQQTTAAVTACFSPPLFPSKCFVQLRVNTKDSIDFTFCRNGTVCVSDAFVRALTQGLIVFVVAGGSPGRKQQLLHTEAHLQVTVVGWLSQKMLFPLLRQIIIKKELRRQEFPRLAHSSDGFQVEHFEERDWRSWCATGGRGTVGGEEWFSWRD